MYPATTGTGFARCVPPIHQLHIATVLLSLVEQLTLDLKETGIAHCLRQVMVSKHPLRVEVFQANQGISSGNMRGHLVQGVLPPAGHPIVYFCKFLAIFPPVLTTPAYFRSSYVFVTAKSSRLHLQSFDDSILRTLKIGIQVLDDDYAPPAQALARRGVVGNILGFDSEGNDAGDIIRAVASRKVDVAIVWGPLAGYYAKRQSVPLELTPVPAFDPPGIPFRYEISMGVRKNDTELRNRLAEFLQHRKSSIERILRSYSVPVFGGNDADAAVAGTDMAGGR